MSWNSSQANRTHTNFHYLRSSHLDHVFPSLPSTWNQKTLLSPLIFHRRAWEYLYISIIACLHGVTRARARTGSKVLSRDRLISYTHPHLSISFIAARNKLAIRAPVVWWKTNTADDRFDTRRPWARARINIQGWNWLIMRIVMKRYYTRRRYGVIDGFLRAAVECTNGVVWRFTVN